MLDDPDPRAEDRLQPRLRGDQRRWPARSTPGPSRSEADSPERRDYLMKAVAAYRRTLAIDSENVTAHYGWRRPITTRPGTWRHDRTPPRRRRPLPTAVDPDGLLKLATVDRRPDQAAGRRPVATPRMRLGQRRRARSWTGPGRGTSRGSSRCTRSSRSSAPPGIAETDPTPVSALARALEVTHRGCTSGSSPTRRPRARRSPRPGRRTRRPTRTPSRSSSIRSIAPAPRGSIGPLPRWPLRSRLRPGMPVA